MIAYYIFALPASLVPQYLLIGDFELLPVLLLTYQNYGLQAAFDIFITCLVLVALPSAYTRPRWYKPRAGQEKPDEYALPNRRE